MEFSYFNLKSLSMRVINATVGCVFLAAIVLNAASGTAFGQAADKQASDIASLQIAPATIQLGGPNRVQQVLVTAISKDGKLFDVTHACEISVSDSEVAWMNGAVVAGVTDGKTRLNVQFGSVTASALVVVDDFNTYPPVHFRNDVIPLFSKLGCNSGGCHGKQAGQNGFKLSVFGFDPQADFTALVHEARGRRVFPGNPAQSLLVQKATGLSAHGGGRRMEIGSADAELLIEWIHQGMPWGDDRAATVVSVSVEPRQRVVDMRSDQQLLVMARYSDGRFRDVTSAATYTSNAAIVADVDQLGRVSAGKISGEAAVTINYMGHVAAAQILVARPEVVKDYPTIPVNNGIDPLVWSKLKKMRIVPSELADDATFLRRLYLDAIGTLPTPAEVRAFLNNKAANKRHTAIDAVLDRDEFADYWAAKWGDILLVDREKLGARGAYEFHRWLRQQFATNRPYDQWVRELLTATGNSGKQGPVNFYRAVRTPPELTRAVSQAFLGIRMDCAQCHHHPFEKWGQEDFYGLAGFFNGMKHRKLGDDRELVYHAGYQTTKMPLTGKVVLTRPPGGAVDENIADGDPRVRLANWLTADDNPWFARLVANRLWKHYLGRGLVEPEDDLRSTNPPTNEPLLAFLSRQVVENNYDLQAVMRLILRSRVYQLSSVPNRTNFDDEQNFSHHLVKRLPAAVLLDAVSQVTGSPERFPGMPIGTRSIQLWDNRMPSYFLDTFGRSERKSPCECAQSSEPTMAQTLHLMNAPEIDVKISDPAGRITKLTAAGTKRNQLVEELCLAALGRFPAEKDQKVVYTLFQQESPRKAAEDFLWTLLNSYDFLFIK